MSSIQNNSSAIATKAVKSIGISWRCPALHGINGTKNKFYYVIDLPIQKAVAPADTDAIARRLIPNSQEINEAEMLLNYIISPIAQKMHDEFISISNIDPRCDCNNNEMIFKLRYSGTFDITYVASYGKASHRFEINVKEQSHNIVALTTIFANGFKKVDELPSNCAFDEDSLKILCGQIWEVAAKITNESA